MSIRDYEQAMKSVADPTRMRILKLLEGGEMCVCQLIAVIELKQSTISRHLLLLKRAGLVKERKDGKWVHYSLDGSNSSRYARKMLQNLKGWLNDDRIVKKDRIREKIARDAGPREICERGMTLPMRRTATCCPAPRKEAVGTR
ncbi:MAG: ArsR family transcriptional regulator [Deltaproteobacteria bacterium]|nr:MAG: ArsR family transcriptional regulator [Deltaproteobacteria bacterium]